MLIWHTSHTKSGAIPQWSCCCCDALAPRIIPTPSNDDFQRPSPKLFNAGQAGPKYTFSMVIGHLRFGVAGEGCPAPAPGQERAGVEQLLASLDIDQAAYRLGNTQVTTFLSVTWVIHQSSQIRTKA